MTVLCAKARYEAPEIETHVRVAEHEGAIYLDLCDKDWRQVEITADGWRLIAALKPCNVERANLYKAFRGKRPPSAALLSRMGATKKLVYEFSTAKSDSKKRG